MVLKSKRRINSSWFLKFYTFAQNNSGGQFVIKAAKGIGHIVVIQAANLEAALDKAESIGIYFDGVSKGLDCRCCGDRWSSPTDMDTDEPQMFGSPVSKMSLNFYPIAIHYTDGTMMWYDNPKEI